MLGKPFFYEWFTLELSAKYLANQNLLRKIPHKNYKVEVQPTTDIAPIS